MKGDTQTLINTLSITPRSPCKRIQGRNFLSFSFHMLLIFTQYHVVLYAVIILRFWTALRENWLFSKPPPSPRYPLPGRQSKKKGNSSHLNKKNNPFHSFLSPADDLASPLAASRSRRVNRRGRCQPDCG